MNSPLGGKTPYYLADMIIAMPYKPSMNSLLFLLPFPNLLHPRFKLSLPLRILLQILHELQDDAASAAQHILPSVGADSNRRRRQGLEDGIGQLARENCCCRLGKSMVKWFRKIRIPGLSFSVFTGSTGRASLPSLMVGRRIFLITSQETRGVFCV